MASWRIARPVPGSPMTGHMYVEYFIPATRRSVGLIMWHSSSTKVWENRWDGGEGYKSIFLRRGYPVYLWDGHDRMAVVRVFGRTAKLRTLYYRRGERGWTG